MVLPFLTLFDMGFLNHQTGGGGGGALCCYCSDDHEIWHRYQLDVFYTVVTKSL